MKIHSVLAIFLIVSCLSPLAAQESSYQNTVYLPYYRMQRPTETSTYQLEQGQDSNRGAFDFASYDTELVVPQSKPYSEPSVPKFQEYLIAALGTGRITQINYFRLLPSKAGDGSIDFSGFYPQHLEYLQKLRAVYGFRLVVCLAGGSSRFLPVIKRKELRKKLARNLIAVAETWELDGIDFDWEYPRNKNDMAAYIALIKEVRSSIPATNKNGGKNYRVSVAISRKQAALSSQLFQAVDAVNFMGYDFAPRHSTMEDITEMVAYLSARYTIPSQKIFLGLPFYGREIRSSGRRRAKTYRYLAQNFDLAPEDNEIENYYFNGQDMIARKFEFAQQQDLGGIMIWEIGQDSNDHRSLLRILPRQE